MRSFFLLLIGDYISGETAPRVRFLDALDDLSGLVACLLMAKLPLCLASMMGDVYCLPPGNFFSLFR